ncbi:MAG: type II toxin-antitoxin system RelB/DinJ family antitoxin [Defluviitaleaceae bacterium]|nr:type II toxin-antitoxin system RelB/DinJ family antitoxin [Defluviitaleaceae bacterium]
MATTNYTLRIEEADKQKAEYVFKELGMTFATGMNVYIKMVGQQQKIPFELALTQPLPTPPVSITKSEKEKAFMALDGILAGHEVDLDQAREERILAK